MPESVAVTVYSSAGAPAAFVIAHGAGAGQSSPFMARVARGLVERGVTAVTFDFPYMTARRKAPDKKDVLEASWRGAIRAARAETGNVPLFIGGKSMGGRIASQVAAAEHDPIAGVIFLGYPLHPPGKPQQRRDAHLPAIREPMLFVQGSRDPFGTAREIRDLLPALQRAELYAVEGGDHSFKVPSSARSPAGDVIGAILDRVAGWIRSTTGRE